MHGMHAPPDTPRPAPDSARLFLALWPGASLREQLLAARDAWTWPRHAGPVPAGSLHVTLHFLGSLPREKVTALADGLDVPVGRATLVLTRAVLWPRGIAVLEPDAVPAPLVALHAALGDALLGLGVPVETRPWRPHATMARRATGAQPPATIAPIRWPLRGYALIESLALQGGGYRVVRRYPARQAAGG